MPSIATRQVLILSNNERAKRYFFSKLCERNCDARCIEARSLINWWANDFSILIDATGSSESQLKTLLSIMARISPSPDCVVVISSVLGFRYLSEMIEAIQAKNRDSRLTLMLSTIDNQHELAEIFDFLLADHSLSPHILSIQ